MENSKDLQIPIVLQDLMTLLSTRILLPRQEKTQTVPQRETTIHTERVELFIVHSVVMMSHCSHDVPQESNNTFK
jgi:hypothetical protein